MIGRPVLPSRSCPKRASGQKGAVENLGGNLVFLDDETILARPGPTPSRAGLLGLPGVAEPCALALARRGVLLLPKKKYGGVTLAIAR